MKRRHAFTLIELLVVISIIALLIGILLPALGAARGVARQAVCLGHLRGAGQGLAAYMADHNGYFPGANTSGAHMTGVSSLTNAQKRATAASSASAPLQSMDWVSPTLGSSLGLPADPVQRMIRIFEHDFRCPANEVFYSGSYGGGSIYSLPNSKVPVSSYSMNEVWQFRNDGIPGKDPADGDSLLQMSEIDGLYSRLRIEDFKKPSLKAAVSEGNRFMGSPMDPTGNVTFNGLAFDPPGENFSHAGWIYTGSGGNPYKWGSGSTSTNNVRSLSDDLTPGSRATAFRHPGTSINMLFFDSSARNLRVEDAVSIKHHMPSGVRVASARNTADPNDANGDIVE